MSGCGTASGIVVTTFVVAVVVVFSFSFPPPPDLGLLLASSRSTSPSPSAPSARSTHRHEDSDTRPHQVELKNAGSSSSIRQQRPHSSETYRGEEEEDNRRLVEPWPASVPDWRIRGPSRATTPDPNLIINYKMYYSTCLHRTPAARRTGLLQPHHSSSIASSSNSRRCRRCFSTTTASSQRMRPIRCSCPTRTKLPLLPETSE